MITYNEFLRTRVVMTPVQWNALFDGDIEFNEDTEVVHVFQSKYWIVYNVLSKNYWTDCFGGIIEGEFQHVAKILYDHIKQEEQGYLKINIDKNEQILEAKILDWYLKTGRDKDFAEFFEITSNREGKIN